MPDSHLNGAERGVQQSFIKSLFFNALLVGLSTFAFQSWLYAKRPPLDLSSVQTTVIYRPVELAPQDGSVHVAGAWEIEVDDPRFGGISGLALDGGKLLALSDSGMLYRLDLPGSPNPRAVIRALPAVAGNPRFKSGRDSEALLADPSGQGWWVAFEHDHALLRYDHGFTRLLQRIPLADRGFPVNRGIEALAPNGRGIRAIPESAGISDAAALPGGGVAILYRQVGVLGFASRMVAPGLDVALRLAPYDNPEGIAAAPLPEGGTRLWIVTDNDALLGRRTLLVALDVPAAPKR